MKNKILLVAFALVILTVVGFVLVNKNSSGELNSPAALPQTLPTPTPTPVVYNFDRSTDLKAELDSINPEVNDTDFEPLQEIIDNL